MASIRELKKDINYLTYELLTEAFAYKHFHPEMEEKKLDEVILKLVQIRNDLISRINKSDLKSDPSAVKGHFKKIRSEVVDLVKVVDGIIK